MDGRLRGHDEKGEGSIPDMPILKKLIAMCSALTVTTGLAHAAPGECQLKEWWAGSAQVLEGSNRWTYSMKSTGSRWKIGSFGWHAPGMLKCASCGHWLFHYFTDHGIPPTVRERIARGKESFRRPSFHFNAADVVRFHAAELLPLASRDDIKIGPMSGYAVRYRATARPSSQNEPGAWNLLILSLSDGCLNFETSILTERPDDDWSFLDSILQEISIARIPTEEVEPPSALQPVPTSPEPEPAKRLVGPRKP